MIKKTLSRDERKIQQIEQIFRKKELEDERKRRLREKRQKKRKEKLNGVNDEAKNSSQNNLLSDGLDSYIDSGTASPALKKLNSQTDIFEEDFAGYMSPSKRIKKDEVFEKIVNIEVLPKYCSNKREIEMRSIIDKTNEEQGRLRELDSM